MELTKEKIRIVEYHEGLAEGVAEMWNKSREGWGGDAQITTAEKVRVQEANSGNLNLYLAMAGDEVVGYCGLCEYREDEGALYIPLLNVRTDYHGKKIGRELVLKALERTVELGWPRLDLYTWAGNTKAVPLYKKCGFFWEDRDDTTHLMNFMPTVLNTEAVADFFAGIDWYGTGTRTIDVAPDGRKDNGFTYYEYSWESDRGTLKMEFERTGRGVRSIETDDYLFSVSAENFQLVSGAEYTVTYHLKNKSGKPLKVELEGKDHKNVTFDFKTSVAVEDETTIEAKFALGGLEEEQSNWRTHPSVVTRALINGKEAEFAVGVLPKQPAKVKGTVPSSPSFLEEEAVFYLDVENNFSESAAFTIEFPDSELLELRGKSVTVDLAAKAKTSISVPYMLKRFGFYAPELKVEAVTESGLRTTFAKRLGLGFKGPGARFSGECEDYWHIYNGLYHMYLRKFDNRLVPGRQTKGMQKTMGLFPKLGKPYSSEFSKRRPASVSYREEGGAMVMEAVYVSTDFDGLELVSESKLYGEGMLEQSYTVRNTRKAETESPISLYQPVYHELNQPVFALDGEIVAFEDKSDGDYGLWDSKRISENWLFSRQGAYAQGVAWPRNASVHFESWYMYVEHELGHIPAGGELRTKPVTFTFGAYQDWREFREYATRQKHKIEVPAEPIEVQAAAREDGSTEIILSDRKTSFIDGAVGFAMDESTFYKTEVAQDERKREVSAFTERGVAPLSCLSAAYEINGISDTADALVLNSGDGPIAFGANEREGLQVLAADNGVLSIAAAEGFYPSLFSLKVGGREWLDTSFPALAPRAWWNPWAGGMVTGFEGINTKSFAKEKTEVAPVSLLDGEGRTWQGLRVSTVFEKNEGIKGLGIHQYFCMLPGVPVLANVTKLSQHSGTYFHRKNWFSQLFFKEGWVKNAGDRKTYHAGKSEIVSFLSGHAVVGSNENDAFLQIIADREMASMETYMNKEVMLIGVDREVDLADGSEWLSSPSFIVANDRVLTKDEVKALQKLTFKEA